MRTKQIDLLKWHLETFFTLRPTEDTIYFLEHTEELRDISDIRADEVVDFFDKGYRPSLDEYYNLHARLNITFKNLIKDYISSKDEYNKGGYTHAITLFNSEYNRDDRDIKEKVGLKPITNDLLETILTYYLSYNGVRNGFIDDNEPRRDELGELHTEELRHIFYLLNGVYGPNRMNPLELWQAGQYTPYSYNRIKYVVKTLIRDQPELIGTHNIQIMRELRLVELLND